LNNRNKALALERLASSKPDLCCAFSYASTRIILFFRKSPIMLSANLVCIDQWFPVSQQRHYAAKMIGRVGLTRCRAEYFVRLWAYLLMKQQQELGVGLKQPIAQLSLPVGFVSCTHREAAELFYGTKDRGSDRAAGMMLDKLAALGLIRKQFDGNTICIEIRSLVELVDLPQSSEIIQLQVDQFNPRTDTIPVANFLARNYNWRYNHAVAIPYNIAGVLRRWAEQSSRGLRVLRRCDNGNPVGFYALYPVAQVSEENFFLPPRKSLHLSSASEVDPIQMATPGDRDCRSVFVRSWMIDQPYLQRQHLCTLLQDTQTTLQQMQNDLPHLCDLQTLIIHPSLEKLAIAVGFQKTGQDSQSSIYWMYLALDRFLSLDIRQAVAGLELEQLTAEL
jgi:hypothetical protein